MNNANTIFAIFQSKSLYGLRDTNEIIITPNKGQFDDEVDYSAEDIRKRYMPYSDKDIAEGGNNNGADLL